MSVEYSSIYTASGQAEAQMILLLLESAGIPAEAAQESYGQTLGLTVGSLGAVEILVPEKFAADAENLIDAYQRGELEKDPPEEDDDNGL